MTLNETLKQLKALGDEAMRKQNAKWGVGDNQFGVKHGDIRALAKKIKSSPELAMPLWKTRNIDAQYLAAQTPQAGYRHWREIGNLSGLSRFEGLHVTLRPDLD
jgi:3-methyladenine DNA glycosylase AlkD